MASFLFPPPIPNMVSERYLETLLLLFLTWYRSDTFKLLLPWISYQPETLHACICRTPFEDIITYTSWHGIYGIHHVIKLTLMIITPSILSCDEIKEDAIFRIVISLSTLSSLLQEFPNLCLAVYGQQLCGLFLPMQLLRMKIHNFLL